MGFVYKGHVDKLSGPEPPEMETVTEPAAMTKPPAPPPPAFRARGYASGAYEWFLANDSFKAILDQSGGLLLRRRRAGIFRHIFVDVGWEQFKKSGSRVVVVDGEVFPLGIKDTITMQPFRVTGGYRFRLSNGQHAPTSAAAAARCASRKSRSSPSRATTPTNASAAGTSSAARKSRR